jgi:Domain of unknown function (DUF4333)
LLSPVRTRACCQIAVALAGVGIAGCGSSSPKILDTERVERAIEQSVLQKRHLKATVSCPSGIKQKKGAVFRCIATYKGGRTPFVVTQDAGGAVHYVGVKG